jgi:hypothetical protein
MTTVHSHTIPIPEDTHPNLLMQAPRALFLSPNGTIAPDTLICSGIVAAELEGRNPTFVR